MQEEPFKLTLLRDLINHSEGPLDPELNVDMNDRVRVEEDLRRGQKKVAQAEIFFLHLSPSLSQAFAREETVCVAYHGH